MPKATLKRGDLAALARAVRRAAEWKGLYVGDPDDPTAEWFEAEMRRARAALRRVRRVIREAEQEG